MIISRRYPKQFYGCVKAKFYIQLKKKCSTVCSFYDCLPTKFQEFVHCFLKPYLQYSQDWPGNLDHSASTYNSTFASKVCFYLTQSSPYPKIHQRCHFYYKKTNLKISCPLHPVIFLNMLKLFTISYMQLLLTSTAQSTTHSLKSI